MTTTNEPIQQTKPGVYRGLPFTDYVKIEAVNFHLLEPYRRSAKQARHEMLSQRDATDAMKAGEATHAAVLEPERFGIEYAAMPQFDGHPNSKIYRDAKAAWIEEHKGLVTMTRQEYEECRTMGQAVAAHRVASALLMGRGRNELSLVWTDKETGSLCKGRIDRLCYAPAPAIFPGTDSLKASDQVLCLVDLKTTRAVMPGPRDFEAEVGRYGYHAQLAFYYDGLQALEPAPVVPIIIAVQNEPPFDVVVYRFDESEIEKGRKLYRRLLNRHLTCMREKDWPGACDSIVSVTLPAWADEHEGLD